MQVGRYSLPYIFTWLLCSAVLQIKSMLVGAGDALPTLQVLRENGVYTCVAWLVGFPIVNMHCLLCCGPLSQQLTIYLYSRILVDWLDPLCSSSS
jgi:hypothetical protein